MNTKIMTQEQISAFSDGEIADSHVELVLASLRQDESRATWDAYHHIGDVLRSDEMAFDLSSDFSARMAARLEKEPAIIAPKIVRAIVDQRRVASGGAPAPRNMVRRYAFSGIAVAAAALALLSGPQLMVAMQGGAVTDKSTVMIASTTTPGAASEGMAVVASAQREGAVLRDPRIDDYLSAHQRFSPSVFSTAQYARNATFSTDSNK